MSMVMPDKFPATGKREGGGRREGNSQKEVCEGSFARFGSCICYFLGDDFRTRENINIGHYRIPWHQREREREVRGSKRNR